MEGKKPGSLAAAIKWIRSHATQDSDRNFPEEMADSAFAKQGPPNDANPSAARADNPES